MKKTILSSVISITALSTLMSIPAFADNYVFRHPIQGISSQGALGGSGGGENVNENAEPEDTTYCDLDTNLVNQWQSAGVTSSGATDSGLFENPNLYFTSNTNGLSGSQLPQFPSKCFETITAFNYGIETLDFLNNVTQGGSIVLNTTWGITDLSGVRNIVELNTFYLNPSYSEYDFPLIEQKIPSSSWLCQPAQASVFTGVPQEKLCNIESTTSPWDEFAEDNNLENDDWNNIDWPSEGISDLPTEPYPTPSVGGSIDLSDNNITDITGLDDIEVINGNLELSNNPISSYSPISDLVVNGNIGLSPLASGNKLAHDSVFCEQNDETQFTNATKSEICEASLDFEYNWHNYLTVIKGGYTDPNFSNIVLDYSSYDVNEVADLYYDNTSNEFNFNAMCQYSNYDCTLVQSDFSFDTQLPTMAQDPYPVSSAIFRLLNSSHIDNLDSLRSVSVGSFEISGNSGLTEIDLSNNGSAQHPGLTKATSINISDNHNLTTIRLNSLTDLQRLTIENNPDLETIEIKNLSVIGPTMGSQVYFVIRNNPMLSNVDIGTGLSTVDFGQLNSQPLDLVLTGNTSLTDITFLQNIDFSNDNLVTMSVNLDANIVNKAGFNKLTGSVCDVRKTVSYMSDSDAKANGYYEDRFTNIEALDVCNSINIYN